MKKIIFIISVVIFFSIIHSLAESIYILWQKHDLIVKAEKDLILVKKENLDIKNKLNLSQSPDFIEKEARDKLFWTKEGESSVVLDKNAIQMVKKVEEKAKQPNWLQWFSLFF